MIPTRMSQNAFRIDAAMDVLLPPRTPTGARHRREDAFAGVAGVGHLPAQRRTARNAI